MPGPAKSPSWTKNAGRTSATCRSNWAKIASAVGSGQAPLSPAITNENVPAVLAASMRSAIRTLRIHGHYPHVPVTLPGVATTLIEREDQLGVATGLLERSEGSVLVVDGVAGVGKTRLVGEIAARARARGMEVLSARSGELERDVTYGVVRQLFERRLHEAED